MDFSELLITGPDGADVGAEIQQALEQLENAPEVTEVTHEAPRQTCGQFRAARACADSGDYTDLDDRGSDFVCAADACGIRPIWVIATL